MDIGTAYTFIFKEDDWIKKIAIGGGISLFSWLLLPYFFVVGYQLAVMRNVVTGEEHPLPDWKDWGKLFTEGAMLWVAQLVYTLPIILLSLCSGLLSGIASSDGNEMSSGVIAVNIVLSCLMVLLGIVLAFIIPALYVQYVRTDDFGSLFRFADVIEIARGNVVNILLVIVAGIAAGIVLGLLVTITLITICGWLIVAVVGGFWINVATAHLYGQIAAKDKGKIIDPTMA